MNNFKVPTAEHYTQCEALLSTGFTQLHRLHFRETSPTNTFLSRSSLGGYQVWLEHSLGHPPTNPQQCMYMFQGVEAQETAPLMYSASDEPYLLLLYSCQEFAFFSVT